MDIPTSRVCGNRCARTSATEEGTRRGRTKPKLLPPPRAPGGPPLATFGNVGAGFENGLAFTDWGGRKTRDDRKANNSKDNPDANCRPLGLMQLHTHPFEKKIVQGNGTIVIMYNANNDVRQILTNGQPSQKWVHS